jgi:hypothetical protein
MPSSSVVRSASAAAVLLAVLTAPRGARADNPPQGFALDRLYLSAPGAGWLVMDDLAMHGSLGGVVAFTAGYAHNPLRVSAGSHALTIVSDQATADLGLALTLDRFRFYVNMDAPLVTLGQAGTIDGTTFVTPKLDLGMQPDTLADGRVGVDVRLVGSHESRFRLGLGAQLFVPNGPRTTSNLDGSYSGCAYSTDGDYRAMLRALVAGDLGGMSYAAHLGVHLRQVDEPSTPGNPRGSELLFGAAAGSKIPLAPKGATLLVVGPEVWGETAFKSFFGGSTTGIEGLVSARLEHGGDDGPLLRVKLGVGGGLDSGFGAPDFRATVGVELSDRTRPRPVAGPPEEK